MWILCLLLYSVNKVKNFIAKIEKCGIIYFVYKVLLVNNNTVGREESPGSTDEKGLCKDQSRSGCVKETRGWLS